MENKAVWTESTNVIFSFHNVVMLCLLPLLPYKKPKMIFFSAYFLKISLVCANKIAQPECYMRSQLSWKGVEQVHEKENKEEEEEEEGGTVRGTSLAPGASNRPVHTRSYRQCTLHNVWCDKHPNRRQSKCPTKPFQQRAWQHPIEMYKSALLSFCIILARWTWRQRVVKSKDTKKDHTVAVNTKKT